MIETDFSASVGAFIAEAMDKGRQVFRGIATDAVTKVKSLTPVDTGYLRDNFVDVLDGDAVPHPQPHPSEGGAIARAEIGETIYVVNPVPYARRIEYGFVGEDSLGRHYNEPGRHMVAQTVGDLPEIAEEVVARLT